jgi:hypothetical protein
MSWGLSLLDRPVFGLSDDELFTRLDSIVTLERQLAASRLETIYEISGRGTPAKRGYASPKMWLHRELKTHSHAAGEMVYLAKAIQSLPDVAGSLAKGEVSEAQAAAIAKAIDAISREASPAEQEATTRCLIEQAAICTPEELVKAGNHALSYVAPAAAEDLERKQAEAQERKAWENRTLSLTNDSSGRVRINGWLTAEAAAIFRSVLDPLCNPARHRRPDGSPADPLAPCPHNEPVPDDPFGLAQAQPCARCHEDGESTDDDHARDGLRDPRTPAQRRHDALVEICQLLLGTGELPVNGGSKPQLTLTLPYDLLNQQLKMGTLDTGEKLTAEATRRLACDAGIIPAILDGKGLPLDLGRERRLIDGALRRALILRDKGCAFPGCDRPPRWCQGHHVTHWVDGGETTLANSVLLCGFHHRFSHDGDWEIRFGPDGLPRFIPPAYIDSERRPRRNLYWQRN